MISMLESIHRDWYHDISDQEGGEETEINLALRIDHPEDEEAMRRSAERGNGPRTMPRPPPPSRNDAPPTQDIDGKNILFANLNISNVKS